MLLIIAQVLLSLSFEESSNNPITAALAITPPTAESYREETDFRQEF